MNRKLVNGLLLLTLASGGCGMFTSCKDTDEDWKNQVIVGQVSLEEQIQALEDAIKNIKSCECDIDAVKTALLAEMEKKIAALKTLMDEADRINAQGIADNKAAIERIENDIKDLQNDIKDLNAKYSKLEGVYETVKAFGDSLSQIATNTENLSKDQEELRKLLTEYQKMMSDAMTELNRVVGLMQTDINNMQGDIAGINTTLGNIEVEIGGVKTNLADIYAQLGDVTEAITDVKSELVGIKGNLTQLNNTLTQTNNKLDALGVKVNEIEYNLWRLVEEVIENGNTLSSLLNRYDELLQKLEAMGGRVDALETYKTETIEPAIAELGALNTQINGEGGLVEQLSSHLEKINANAANIETLTENVDELFGWVTTNRDKINELNGLVRNFVGALNDRLNSLITGILLNQTWNPMFGSINLPVGLSTTIAANYYGYSDHAFTFPLASKTEFNGDGSVLYTDLPEAVRSHLLQTIKKSEYFNNEGVLSVGDGDFYMSTAENNLGQLYLTINPNNINFNNQKISLVNSKGEEAPLEDIYVKTCTDEELTFGANISRASYGNGFYRANLSIKPENAPKIGVRVEEGLKSAMKDALKDHTKQDFAQLAKVVFNQLDGILPAYAVKAEWEAPVVVDEKTGETRMDTFAVYSPYNIAATAFRPLGYMFLNGVDLTDHKIKLPTYEGSVREIIDEIFKDLSFNVEVGQIDEMTEFNIDLSKVKINFEKTEIEINLKGLELKLGDNAPEKIESDTKIILYYDPTNGTIQQPGMANLDGFFETIENAIQNMLDGTGDDSLKTQISSQVLEQMNSMIRDINAQLLAMQNSINKQINDKIESIKSSLAGKLGRFDRLVDLYNNLANRINGFLSDPNHYLQVMMAYEDGNGSLHHMSTSEYYPSVFRKAGGNAVELFLTSYTAELIAPSYAKYVAVSRVMDEQGNWISSTADADKVNNNNEFLNKALRGDQQRVVINVNDLTPGYTYEILYSSVDYRGYTSTNLYYLTVAK